MYTMVLMMSMSGSGDVASFGGRNRDNGCSGAVAVSCTGYSSYAGCSGYSSGYSTGCSGYSYSGCSGYSAGCNGSDRGGFLGLRNRDRGGCNGRDRGGFLGLCNRDKDRGGCHGGVSYGCSGYAAPSYGCTGYGHAAYAAPVASYGCTGYAAPVSSCCAPIAATGCTGAIVTGTTPAVMPTPVTPMPMKEVTPAKETKKPTGSGT